LAKVENVAIVCPDCAKEFFVSADETKIPPHTARIQIGKSSYNSVDCCGSGKLIEDTVNARREET